MNSTIAIELLCDGELIGKSAHRRFQDAREVSWGERSKALSIPEHSWSFVRISTNAKPSTSCPLAVFYSQIQPVERKHFSALSICLFAIRPIYDNHATNIPHCGAALLVKSSQTANSLGLRHASQEEIYLTENTSFETKQQCWS